MNVKKTFDDLVRENPDAFDYPDAGSVEPTYPPQSVAAALPEHIKRALKEKLQAEKALEGLQAEMALEEELQAAMAPPKRTTV